MSAGQSESTAQNYHSLLKRFVTWAATQNLLDWKQVELKHLMLFLEHERNRPLDTEEPDSTRRLSSESIYLEIAALRAFYRYAENEKLLSANIAENLSLPRRWKRLPKALTDAEVESTAATAAATNALHTVRSGRARTGLRFRSPHLRVVQHPAPNNCTSKRAS